MKTWALRFLAFSVMILLMNSGRLLALELVTGESEISFAGTRDKSAQLAIVYAPAGIDTEKAAPLLVHLHYYKGDRFTAKALGYYAQADKRKWYILCPELHGDRSKGGAASFASRNAQQDVLDAVAAVRAQHPNIDGKRIFLSGRSMGGMLAAVMLTKHPDLFAGAVAGAPITDVATVFEGSVLFAEGTEAYRDLVAEMGGRPESVPFEYARRSACLYAGNARYSPLVLWSGTNDTWVPMAQSERLDAAIRKSFPYQPPVHWVVGGNHCSMNYTAAWVCDQLQYFENAPESRIKTPWRYYPVLDFVTDESQAFYWVSVEVAADGTPAHIRAAIVNAELVVDTTNVKTLEVNVNNAVGGIAGKAAQARLTSYRILSDGAVTVSLLVDNTEWTRIAVGKEKVGKLE